jgi:hypothetical protein
LPLALYALAFLAVAIALFSGMRWAPSAYVALSALVLLPRVLTRAVDLFLFSAAALLIAAWYFRQPTPVGLYQGEPVRIRALEFRILGIPLDLGLGLLFLAIGGIIEVFSLITILGAI